LKDADSKSGNMNMASKQDGYLFLDEAGKKDTPFPANKLDEISTKYASNITKENHNKLMIIIRKPESTWNSEEKALVVSSFSKIL